MIEIKNILPLEFRARLSADPQAPLFWLVHGRAGSRDSMWTFSGCIPQEASVVAVQAPLSDPIGGYSWWTSSDNAKKNQQRKSSVQLTASFMENFKQHSKIFPSYEIAIGFSQGAGLVSLITQNRPELFRGVAFLCGFFIEDEQSRLLGAARSPRVFIAHGEKDEIVPVSLAKKSFELLKNKGLAVQLCTDPEAGHKVGLNCWRELKAWCHSL
jgi:phospholipase/carboxylesterase